MKHNSSFGFTWKGVIFSIIFLGVFIVPPLTIILTHFYPELDRRLVAGVIAGLLFGPVSGVMHWDRTKRAMEKFLDIFGHNGGK